VLGTVEHYGVNPKRIKFEITEGILLEKKEEARETIQQLKSKGFDFSLDDFGTGYSSLQYLQKLPLGQLKIDQSFVQHIEDNLHDFNIVRTIIAMASSLGIQCVAEGVETEGQFELLLAEGCNFFQGYLFGRPLAASEFEASLRASS
jgi:EAL domain-containing protein (putative c-di-GMP-specific phosphodiesterase class I)